MIYRKKQYLGDEEEKLSADIIYGEGKRTQTEINDNILDQFPTATITTTNGTANVQDSSNLPLKDIQVLGNATQEGTPTPSTPQDIHVVTGDNTVKVIGKNLFNGVVYWENSTITDTGEQTVSQNNFDVYKINIKPNTTYTAQEINNYTSGTTNVVMRVCSFDKNNNFLNLEYRDSSPTGFNSHTFTTPANASYILMQHRKTDTNIQLEVGSTATTYEPYVEQSVTLPLGDIELAGIGDYKDRIYKDNGKWYVYKVTGKGTQDSTNYDSFGTSYTNLNVLVMTKITSDVKNGSVTRAIGWLSNKFTYSTRPNGYDDANLINCIYDSANNKYYIGLPKTITTAEQAVESIGSYDLYYVRKTPTTTEITDSTLLGQLEAIYNASTYKNVTNFSITPSETNATGDLTITYRQDISSVLSTIATLEARVELLE